MHSLAGIRLAHHRSSQAVVYIKRSEFRIGNYCQPIWCLVHKSNKFACKINQTSTASKSSHHTQLIKQTYRKTPTEFTMNYFRVFAIFAVIAIVMAAFVPNGAEAGKKKILKKAAMAALLLKGGKKILLPLPIPIPLPILKQTQPVYYQQPSYSSHY